MANKIRKFFSEQFGELRTIKRDRQVWFFATDVCRVLEYKHAASALRKLDDDERMTVLNQHSHSGQKGGAQSYVLVNEYGLWQLVMRSNLPKAKDFKRWLTHEVIPSIRKNGGYISEQEKLPAKEKAALEQLIADLSNKIEKMTADNASLKDENLQMSIDLEKTTEALQNALEVVNCRDKFRDVYREDDGEDWYREEGKSSYGDYNW